MGQITTLQQLNENHQRETYWGDDKETVLFFANGMYQMKQKHDVEISKLKNSDIKEMLSQLIESQNSIKEDVSYVKAIYTTAKQPRTKKITQSKAEQKSVLRMKLLNPRNKG